MKWFVLANSSLVFGYKEYYFRSIFFDFVGDPNQNLSEQTTLPSERNGWPYWKVPKDKSKMWFLFYHHYNLFSNS